MAHIENNTEYKGLTVNDGVKQPPMINPYMTRRVKRQELGVSDYVEGILAGNRTILSRAVTLVESLRPEHHAMAQEVIERCLPHAGKSIRLGITGVPGAGKSTFIEALGMHLVKEGHKLAVLAIDPSSERSKGSILGDKTRMEELSSAANAFIRPSPSAGSLGGVARKTQIDYPLRSCRFRHRDSGNRRRRTIGNGNALYGRLLPADTAGRHRRRAARHKARHYGNGRRHNHQ